MTHPVPLTRKAFQILLVIVRRSGDVATKDEIMKTVWPDTFVEETNLTRNIFSIRKALGEESENQYILTVSGKGYRLSEKVVPVLQSEAKVVSAIRSKSKSRKNSGRTDGAGSPSRRRSSSPEPLPHTCFFARRPA